MEISTRPIASGDWSAVWPIIRQVCADGRTFTYPRDISEELARQIWIQPSPARTVVATDRDGAILGTAKIGPNQMGPGGHVATASFMVAERARGHGIGRTLGEYAIDWATRAGYRAMQFNAVVAVNTPAVRLWRSLAFEVVGTVPNGFELPDGEFSDLLILHRPL